ncbi:hypothetical protein ACFQ0M_48240 [Kitasatospora aburaviensis]
MIETILFKAIPAALVAISLWRLPAALRSGRAARSLCITVGTLGLSLGISAVKMPLHDLVTGLSVLLRHLLGMTSIAFLLDYLYAVHGRGLRGRARPNLPLAAVASATMTLLFFFAVPRDPVPDPDFLLDVHQGEPAVVIYQAIFYAYLGTAMALGAKTFGGARRAIPAASSEPASPRWPPAAPSAPSTSSSDCLTPSSAPGSTTTRNWTACSTAPSPRRSC